MVVAFRSIPALLALLLLVGCDSGDDSVTIDEDFFVGSWTLVSASDDSGDRTADLNTIVDDLSADFTSASGFSMSIDFAQTVNDAGTADVVLSGTYTVSSTKQLVLTESGSGTAVSLRSNADSQNHVDLSAPAVIVQALLGQSSIGLNLTGTVVLSMER